VTIAGATLNAMGEDAIAAFVARISASSSSPST
jgi:hypothetical protein